MWTRYRFPFAAMNDLRREIDSLFDEFGRGPERSPLQRFRVFPSLNVWDEGEALCVEAEVPGLQQDDLEMLAMGNELTLKGRRTPLAGDNLTYHRQERGMGEFSRTITLPAEIDPGRVEATLKDGVLSVRLPKAESAKPRKVVVKAS